MLPAAKMFRDRFKDHFSMRSTCLHSYVYDTVSGECVSAFGGGPGRAVVHATRVIDGVVQVDLEPAAGAGELALDTETRNEIGMRCVEQALDLKFGD